MSRASLQARTTRHPVGRAAPPRNAHWRSTHATTAKVRMVLDFMVLLVPNSAPHKREEYPDLLLMKLGSVLTEIEGDVTLILGQLLRQKWILVSKWTISQTGYLIPNVANLKDLTK